MATLQTKSALIDYIKSKVYSNGINACTATMVQDALLGMTESIYGGDLSSTSEVLTGEIYNAKPVYAKVFSGSRTNGTDNIALTNTTDLISKIIEILPLAMYGSISGLAIPTKTYIKTEKVNFSVNNVMIIGQGLVLTAELTATDTYYYVQALVKYIKDSSNDEPIGSIT
jgi:hypothetical protein